MPRRRSTARLSLARRARWAHARVDALRGGSQERSKVSYGTEAGLFQRGGMPAVVCGPGSIQQAHKPDEYIELAQLTELEQFLRTLFARCSA